MGVGMSGLVSGLDTDSIVKALVSGYTKKKEDYQKAQTKVEWKMEAWKSLNTKVYSFYSNSLSDLRFSSNYIKKKTTISDSSVAKVSAGSNSVNGTQSLAISKLAKAGYLTGAQLLNGKGKLTKSSTLSELGITEDASFVVGSEGSEKTINVNGDTTISDLVKQLKSAGVSANFDESNQRFFISAKASGEDNDFTLTASNESGMAALKALGLAGSEVSNKELQMYQEWAKYSTAANSAWDAFSPNGTTAWPAGLFADADYQKALKAEYDKQYNAGATTADKQKAILEDSVKRLKNQNTSLAQAQYLKTIGKELQDKIDAGETVDVKAWLDTKRKDLTDALGNAANTEDDNAMIKSQLNALNSLGTTFEDADAAVKAIGDAEKKVADALGLAAGTDYAAEITDNAKEISDAEIKIANENGELQDLADTHNSALSADLKDKVAQECEKRADVAKEFMRQYNYKLQSDFIQKRDSGEVLTQEERKAYDASINDSRYANILNEYSSVDDLDLLGKADDGSGSGATRVIGQNAEIYLNGARFESADNTMTINGLTITATETTGKNDDGSMKTVSITTADDTDAIYDMIRDLFSEYNSLINEMDKMYNAPSSKGYDPLTDEQKDQMTDSEIEKWETKIKDSILKGDSTLNSVSQVMKRAMMKGFTVYDSIQGRERTMYLSDFGIGTQSYFTAPENEKSAIHIDGDEEDAATKGKTDKLNNMILTDPNAVVSFFSQLTSSLYDNLTTKMQTTTLSSTYTLYNDKQMQSEYSNYNTKISDQETKISFWENYYYSQFTAMESALSRLNSQQSALAGLMGSK